MEWLDPKTFYTILHLFGVAIGAGGAFMSDVLFITSTKDRNLDRSEYAILRTGSMVTWVGLILLIISGYLLYTTNPAGYLASSKFITKMIIVGVLTFNGIIFHIIHLPRLRRLVDKNLAKSSLFKSFSKAMYYSGAISIVSWVFALTLGGLRSIPISVGLALLIYIGALGVGLAGAEIKRKKYLRI